MASTTYPGVPLQSTWAGAESATQALYFGKPERPLFGFLHAPRGALRREGVVLCNPFGYEAICTHRSYRHLAERLASKGYAVLRFDYDGTGDSFGSDADPDRVRAWQDSIRAAIDELRARAEIARITLFGTRLGALLALRVAADHGAVSGLVLWAPCTNGKHYLRELKAMRSFYDESAGTPKNAIGPPGDAEEAAGFLLTETTLSDIAALGAETLADKPAPRVLVIERDDLAPNARLARRLREAGVELTCHTLPGYADVMVDPHKTRLPEAMFECVERWLADAPLVSNREPLPRERMANLLESANASNIRERAVTFGDRARLFGVLSEPAVERQRLATAVLFLNAGAIHRIGMNRMHVSLARAWAARGVPGLRFDISGTGDSAPRGNTIANAIYSRHAIADVRDAMNHLERTHGIRHHVLLGLCSGAYAAFHTALADSRVTSVMLINPQTFDYKEGDSLEVQKRKNFQEARYYQRSLLRKSSWAKALRGEVDFKHILRVMKVRAGTLARSKWSRLRELVSGAEPPELCRAFRELCDRGTSVCLVYSADDPGLEYFMEAVGSGASKRALFSHPNFKFQVIDGPDHTFTPLWSQECLAKVLSENVAFHPAVADVEGRRVHGETRPEFLG